MRDASDLTAFSEFVETRSAALFRTAYLMVGDHQLAHDLLQEALVKTLIAWPGCDRPIVDAYARRIVVTTSISWRRRRASTSGPPATCRRRSGGPRGRQSSRSTPWSRAAHLPPRQRAAIVLRYYQDPPRPRPPTPWAARWARQEPGGGGADHAAPRSSCRLDEPRPANGGHLMSESLGELLRPAPTGAGAARRRGRAGGGGRATTAPAAAVAARPPLISGRCGDVGYVAVRGAILVDDPTGAGPRAVSPACPHVDPAGRVRSCTPPGRPCTSATRPSGAEAVGVIVASTDRRAVRDRGPRGRVRRPGRDRAPPRPSAGCREHIGIEMSPPTPAPSWSGPTRPAAARAWIAGSSSTTPRATRSWAGSRTRLDNAVLHVDEGHVNVIPTRERPGAGSRLPQLHAPAPAALRRGVRPDPPITRAAFEAALHPESRTALLAEARGDTGTPYAARCQARFNQVGSRLDPVDSNGDPTAFMMTTGEPVALGCPLGWPGSWRRHAPGACPTTTRGPGPLTMAEAIFPARPGTSWTCTGFRTACCSDGARSPPAEASTVRPATRQSRSMIVTLAWPPPSHMVCRP